MNIKQLLITAGLTIGLFPAIASAAPAQVIGGTKTATLNVTANLVDPAPVVINARINLAGPLDFGTVVLPTTGTSSAQASTSFTVTVDSGFTYKLSIGHGLHTVPSSFGVRDGLIGSTTSHPIDYLLTGSTSPSAFWKANVFYPGTGTGVAKTYNITSSIRLESGTRTGSVATPADTYSDTRTITLTF